MLMGFTPEAVREERWFGGESCSCRDGACAITSLGLLGLGGVLPSMHLHREGGVWGDSQGESCREQEVSRNKK